jgi:hypothetical protein
MSISAFVWWGCHQLLDGHQVCTEPREQVSALSDETVQIYLRRIKFTIKTAGMNP